MTTCPFCRVTHRVTVPTVHTNGTSAHNLRDDLQAAVEALREGQRRMVMAAPNGRDYYPQGNDAMNVVMAEHERRCIDLNRILTELEEQRDHVQAVLDDMAQRRSAEALRPFRPEAH
jgi:hypothetical protein